MKDKIGTFDNLLKNMYMQGNVINLNFINNVNGKF